MTNLKKILTTLPAATLKKHSLRLRLTAFRRSFKIIPQLFRCGYSRGCTFTPVRFSTFNYGLELLRFVMRMTSEKRQPDFRRIKENYSVVELKSRVSLSHLSVKLLETYETWQELF